MHLDNVQCYSSRIFQNCQHVYFCRISFSQKHFGYIYILQYGLLHSYEVVLIVPTGYTLSYQGSKVHGFLSFGSRESFAHILYPQENEDYQLYRLIELLCQPT